MSDADHDYEQFATGDGPLSETTLTCPADDCEVTFTAPTRDEARALRYVHCRGEHWPDVLTATVMRRIQAHDEEVRDAE